MGLWADTLEKIETNNYIAELEHAVNTWREEAVLKTANAMLIADMFERANGKRPRDYFKSDSEYHMAIRRYIPQARKKLGI